MALVFGFVMAWILTRTNVPGRRLFEQLMAVPYYLTPLLGALAWSLLGSPESGFINQVWRALGGTDYLININTPYGIAWVMALFEGSVAFVMIAAVMKSMDPSLEEASQVMGASRLRTMLRVTLPLVVPGVLGAAIFVFAEMLGSFAAALVLGLPNRYYVITTAIYQLVQQYPPKIQVAAAMGVSLFAVMFVMLFLYRRIVMAGSYVTITGKAFRPRVADVGPLRYVLLGVCVLYLLCRRRPAARHAALCLGAEDSRSPSPPPTTGRSNNFRVAVTMNAVRSALGNSLLLGFGTATIGVVLMGLLAWLIYRSRLPGGGLIEYIVMFPQAGASSGVRVRHDVGLGGVPDPDLRHAVAAADRLSHGVPAARRAHDRGRHAADRQEPGGMRADVRRVLGVPHANRDDAAAGAGLIAAWLLLFIASIRELGASILLMGPHSKVITPSIVEIMVRDQLGAYRRDGADPDAGGRARDDRACRGDAPHRRAQRRVTDIGKRNHARVAVRNRISRSRRLEIYYGSVPAVRGVSFDVMPGEQLTLLGPSGCGKTTTLRAVAGLEQPTAGEIRIDGVPMSIRRTRSINIPAEKRGLSMVFQSYAIWPHMTRVRECRLRLARARAPGQRRSPKKCTTRSKWCRCTALRNAVRRNSRAASSSAWRSPALSYSSLPFCCSTSRCPISTPNCAPICVSNCANCNTGSASRRFTSPTTWKRRWRCRTASW